MENPQKESPVAKVIEVLYLVFMKGDGSENNPCRNVEQYRKLNGDLIFEIDPMN